MQCMSHGVNCTICTGIIRNWAFQCGIYIKCVSGECKLDYQISILSVTCMFWGKISQLRLHTYFHIIVHVPSCLHFSLSSSFPSIPPSLLPSLLPSIPPSLPPSLHAHYSNYQHSVMQIILHLSSMEVAVEVSSLATAGQFHTVMLGHFAC